MRLTILLYCPRSCALPTMTFPDSPFGNGITRDPRPAARSDIRRVEQVAAQRQPARKFAI